MFALDLQIRYLKLFTLCSVFLFSCLLHAPRLHAKDEVLTICSDPWDPWVFGNSGGPATGGLAVDLSKEVFRRMGLPIKINIYPYKRCMDKMKSGECDVLLMVKKTREREAYMLFSDTVVTDPQLVYYSTDRIKHFEWSTWKDFKGHSIGGVLGFDYGDFHSATDKFDISVELVSADTQNISKLLAGRIDFILLSKSTANYYLTHNPGKVIRIKAASKPVTNAQFHFGLSKKGKAAGYLDKLNAVIRHMAADKSLDNILAYMKPTK